MHAGVPKSTIHDVLSGGRAYLPKWETVERLVTSLVTIGQFAGPERSPAEELARIREMWMESRDASIVTTERPSSAREVQHQRLNVVIGERAAHALETLKRQNGLSDTEAINRALLISLFIEESVAEGFEIVMRKPGQESQRVIIP
ncbi:hypothetical protein AB0M95_39355 [Sphaerisporangium sp. NPDC051017]|uniref:hypothetical protein n=1 Tax=Sphaerisporangium sp. NPDC051017 TaxID=3154636 RepID=UPI00343FD4A0